MTTNGLALADAIDDRVDAGMFRVDRGVYFDPTVFELELSAFFEKGWVFLCHASQLPETGSFYATYIGRQPVFLVRQRTGGIKCFINACSHRASMLVSERQGTADVFTCRYHGWVYGRDGKCQRMRGERDGGLPPNADRSRLGLTEIARLETYAGFVFGSLSDSVPDLKEYLGPACAFIDMFSLQSPAGMEVVDGVSTYVCHHNWKLQVENVPDGYHVPVVHRNFAQTVQHREQRPEVSGLMRTETGRISGRVQTGCYDLGHGHSAIWADRASPEVAPIHDIREEVEARVSPVLADWMIRRGRNLMIFPNLVLNDLASTHLRTLRPLTPDRTEVTIWCIAPVGEPRAARAARLRKFEDFFLVSGMATSDDLVSMNIAHQGAAGRQARWNTLIRGIDTLVPGPDAHARELGIEPQSSNSSWDYETMYIGLYRYWRDSLERERARIGAAA